MNRGRNDDRPKPLSGYRLSAQPKYFINARIPVYKLNLSATDPHVVVKEQGRTFRNVGPSIGIPAAFIWRAVAAGGA